MSRKNRRPVAAARRPAVNPHQEAADIANRLVEREAKAAAESLANGSAYGDDDPFPRSKGNPNLHREVDSRNRFIDLTFSEEDLQVEPMLRITIERGAGKDNRIVELRAIDVASIPQEVAKYDDIDFKRNKEGFYVAMRVRLAKMLGVPAVSQLRLNDLIDKATQAIAPQKKTDSDSSDCSSSTEALFQNGSTEATPS